MDHKELKTTIDGMPYVIPTVVRCEAVHQYDDKDERGQPVKRKVHAVAAALPADNVDIRPAAGALAISFTEGPIPGIDKPQDIFKNAQVTNSPADMVQSPLPDDYPAAALSNVQLPEMGEKHPMFEKLLSLSLYDWVRRCGHRLNVQALLSMFQTPFGTELGGPQVHAYQMNADGNLSYDVYPCDSQMTITVSNKQWRGTTGLAYHASNGRFYDVYIRDFVYQPGRTLGGLHAGQPMANQIPAGASVSTSTIALLQGVLNGPAAWAQESDPTGQEIEDNGTGSAPSPGSGLRPTYCDKRGVAVDIKFRARGYTQ